MVPSVKDLFEVGTESGPYAYAIREMARNAEAATNRRQPLFLGWCIPSKPLDEEADFREVTEERLRRSLECWHREDSGEGPLLTQIDPEAPGDKGGLVFPGVSIALPPKPRVLCKVTDLPTEAGWQRPAIEKSKYAYGGWHCTLDHDALLVAPIALGTDCRIRRGAGITWSVIGHGAHIAGRVSRSLIGDGTRVEPGAVVGDSVVGKGCLIGADVVLRSDDELEPYRKEIVVEDRRTAEFPKFYTGRKVLGAIVGDSCVVLADLMPGTVLMPGCHVTTRMRGHMRAAIYEPNMLIQLDRILAERQDGLDRTAIHAALTQR